VQPSLSLCRDGPTFFFSSMTTPCRAPCVFAAVLMLALASLTAGQLTHSTLPACCTDLYDNYNETVSGVLNTNMGVNCNNCGPELTVLGNFTALQYVVYGIGVQGTVTLSCTNCSALATLGNFATLQDVGNYFGFGTLSLTCTNCSALATLGNFATLQDVGNLYAEGTLSIKCTNCSALATLGNFPLLEYVGYYYNRATLSLECTNCAALTTLGNFSALEYVGYFAFTSTLSIACTDCDALTTLGDFPGLTDFAYITSSASVTLTCTVCPHLCLDREGIFPSSLSQSTVATYTSISCIDCGYLDLQDDVCVLSCPAGTYANGSFCEPCSLSCATCSGSAANCTSVTVYTIVSDVASRFTNEISSSQPIQPLKTCLVALDNGQIVTGYAVDINQTAFSGALCCSQMGIIDSNTCALSKCVGSSVTTVYADAYTPVNSQECVPLSSCYQTVVTSSQYTLFQGGLYTGGPQQLSRITKRTPLAPSIPARDVFVGNPFAASPQGYQTAFYVSANSTSYGCVMIGTYTSTTGPCITESACSSSSASSGSYFYAGDSDICFWQCYGSSADA